MKIPIDQLKSHLRPQFPVINSPCTGSNLTVILIFIYVVVFGIKLAREPKKAPAVESQSS